MNIVEAFIRAYVFKFKIMYLSIRYAFHGDYVNLRRTSPWKAALRRNGLKKLDRHVVFADIVNKVHRSNAKV